MVFETFQDQPSRRGDTERAYTNFAALYNNFFMYSAQKEEKCQNQIKSNQMSKYSPLALYLLSRYNLYSAQKEEKCQNQIKSNVKIQSACVVFTE
jgi:hypothetical protein